VGLLFLIGLVLFLVSVLLAGAAFAYNQYFAGQVSSESAQLTEAEQQFQPATIMTLEQLNERIDAGQTLLAQHINAAALFSALAQATLSSVSFSSFEMDPDGSGSFSLSLNGEAASYQALALESDALTGSGVFTAPAFSDVSLDSTGQVTFTLSATVPASALLFSSTLSSLPTSSVSTSTSSSATTTP
jgi:hypothetical protein